WVSSEWRRLAPRGCLPVAVLEDDLGRALHQDERLASSVPVQGGHELVLRLERDGVDARVRFLLGPALHPELAPERVQRAFGGIAFHLPHALHFPDLGVVHSTETRPISSSTGSGLAGRPFFRISPSGA